MVSTFHFNVRSACFWVAFLLCSANGVIAQVSLNKNLPVGTPAGSYSVGANGAANYSLPLWVPQGRSGMQPGLTIVYSSQLGDGLLGARWTLDGLSSITRMGQNLFNDFTITSVQLNDADRLALDGQRLMLTNDAADGKEYHTEIESYFLVKAAGTAGNGPDHFIVKDRSGNVTEYGNTVDSRIEAGGKTTVFTWLINKVTDAKGNYMTYTYDKDTVGGEYYIRKIEYTKNDQVASNPDQQVLFNYEARPDPQLVYSGGVKQQRTKRLSSITMMANGQTAHGYAFAYESGNTTRLISITESGADGSQLNPVTINWNPIGTEVNQQILEDPINIQGTLADFNGDNRTDIVELQGGDIGVTYLVSHNPDVPGFAVTAHFPKFNYGYGPSLPELITPHTVQSFPTIKTDEPEGRFKTVGTGDFNGDGISDLLLLLYPNRYYHPYLIPFYGKTSGGFTPGSRYDATVYDTSSSEEHRFIIADFNGDGKSEVFSLQVRDDYNLYWKVHSFDASFTDYSGFQEAGLGIPLASYSSTFAALDVNGDGKSEIIIFNNQHTYIYGFDQNFDLSRLAVFNAFPMPGDFNGDGNTDLLLYQYKLSGNVWGIAYSKGTLGANNFVVEDIAMPAQPTSPDRSTGYREHRYTVTDMNGDGRQDIIDYSPGARDAQLYLMRGSTFPSPLSYGLYVVNSDPLAIDSTIVDFTPADIKGDAQQDLIYKQYLFAFNNWNNTVQTISNGLGAFVNFNYNYLTAMGGNGYTRDNSNVYPLAEQQIPVQVVTSVFEDNGIGGTNEKDYAYEGMTKHQKGRGMLGFKKTTVDDITSNVTQINTYAFLPSYQYSPLLQQSATLVGGTQNSTTDYTCAVNVLNPGVGLSSGVIQIYTSQTHTEDFLHGTSVDQESVMDAEGNVTSGKSFYRRNGSLDLETNESYSYQKPGNFIYTSAPLSTTMVQKRGGDTYTRSSSYTVNSHGQVTEKNDDNGFTVTSYSYNNPVFNLSSVTVGGQGANARTTSYTYDSRQMNVLQVTNAKNQVSSATYDNVYGNVLTATDINGHVTTNTYDGFGRLLSSKTASQPVANIERSWSTGYGVYKVKTTQAGKPSVTAYFDKMGRNIRSQGVAFDGSAVNIDKSYANWGGVLQVSEPYADGSSPSGFTSYSYDGYHRPALVGLPNGDGVSYSYSGTQVNTHTTGSGQNSSKTMDATGLVLESTDNAGGLHYDYKACGKPKTITILPANTQIKMEYNSLGQQTSLSDPNSGTVSYTYNGLGELIGQCDKPGKAERTYTMSYDVLGRLVSRSSGDNTLSYTYDPVNGKGMPATVSYGGVVTTYTYDSESRLASESKAIDNVNYVTSYSYNALNQVIATGYPSGVTVTDGYTSNGYLQKISKGNTDLWTCNEVNIRGEVTKSTRGSGVAEKRVYTPLGTLKEISGAGSSVLPHQYIYDFDEVKGNLMSRTESGRTESFVYDGSNRLTAVNDAGGVALAMDYDAAGNITKRNDMANGAYNYKGVTGPNQVVKIYQPALIYPSASQVITYTSNNKVETIKEGLNSVKLFYGPGQQRAKMEIKKIVTLPVVGDVETLQSTRYYAGAYEKNKNALTNATREIVYVGSPTGVCAMLVKNGNVDSTYYVYTDHLGSITGITDANNVSKDKRSYDAWGRLRDENWSYPNVKTRYGFNTLTDRGYTAHEEMNEFNLVNMNGRVYDPLVGAMLQPDVVIQDAGNSQSYNRYSYCRNNPLRYSDPSGYSYINYGFANWHQVNQQYLWKSNSMFLYVNGRRIKEGDAIQQQLMLSAGFEAFRNFATAKASMAMHDGYANEARPVEKWTYTTITNPDGTKYSGWNQERVEQAADAGMSVAVFGGDGGFDGDRVEHSYADGGAEADRTTSGDEGFNWGGVANEAFWTEAGANSINVAAETANSGYKYATSAVAAEAEAGRVLTGVAKTTRFLAGSAAFVGAGASVMQFYNSHGTGADYARLFGSGVIMGSAFIPVVGPFISVGLGALDTYGAFDSFYNSFNSPLNIVR